MKITVNKDNVKIEEFDVVHEGEHRVNKCSFSFSEEYTEELVKKAIFTSQNSSVEVAIINNECDIPTEILKARNIVLLGVYAYKVTGDKLDLRYSPSPDAFKVNSGSYIEGASESEEITPSQFEQYMQALNDGLNKVEESIKKMDEATSSANDLVDNINQKLENGDFIGPQGSQGIQGVPGKDGTDGIGITTITSGQSTVEEDKTITPITVNKTDGSSQSFKVEAKNGIDGQNGQNGKDGVNGQDGLTPSIGENGNWFIGDTDTGKPSRGEVGPSPDLSDYVKNTDYASATKAGIIKATNYLNVTSDGVAYASPITQEIYESTNPNVFIAKGTLENIKDDYVGSSNPVITLNNTLDNLVRKNRVSDYIISLKDALKYKVFEFLGHGKVKQETTKGYNLLPYPYTEGSMTINGITFTVNEDGSVIINGTASANASLKLYGQDVEQKQIIGNYLFGGSNNVWLRAVNKNDSGYAVICTSKENSSVAIDKSTYTEGYIELIVPSGTTVNNEIIYPMLSNEKDVEWGPYTGGQPSPNPDYPQEIKTLTFNKITRCGKNLLDNKAVSHTSNGITFTVNEDKTITVNGTATRYTILRISDSNNSLIPIIGNYISGGTSNVTLQIMNNETSSYIQLASSNSYKSTSINKTQFNRGYFELVVVEGTTVNNEVVKPMMTIDSITSEEYEPYQATEYAIDLQGNEMVEIPKGIKDELAIDKQGNVSLVKNVEKVIFDGSDDEDWTFDTISTGTNIRQFHILFENIYYNHVYDKITVLSNYFRGVPWASSWLKNNTVTPYKYGDRTGLRLYSDNFEDLNAFKVWLSTHNVIVYYQLATPEVIPLGKLTNLITTEEGINTFFINGNLETTLEVLYALDIKKYIDNKLAEISSAMIEEG